MINADINGSIGILRKYVNDNSVEKQIINRGCGRSIKNGFSWFQHVKLRNLFDLKNYVSVLNL